MNILYRSSYSHIKILEGNLPKYLQLPLFVAHLKKKTTQFICFSYLMF